MSDRCRNLNLAWIIPCMWHRVWCVRHVDVMWRWCSGAECIDARMTDCERQLMDRWVASDIKPVTSLRLASAAATCVKRRRRDWRNTADRWSFCMPRLSHALSLCRSRQKHLVTESSIKFSSPVSNITLAFSYERFWRNSEIPTWLP